MKHLKVLGLLVFVILALAACSSNANTKVEEKDKMKDDMKGDMKSEMKDDMKSEMKDGEMKDNMKHEMKDEMKDNMKSEKMNDGEVAKDFTLVDKDGNKVTLSSLKGKKVYAKFWASWCSICLAGLEELNDLAGKDNDFEIITVVSPGVRGEKSKDDFVKWFDTLGYENVKVLFDEEAQVMNQFGVRAFPTSVFIGSDSVHVKTLLGHQSNDAILETMSNIK